MKIQSNENIETLKSNVKGQIVLPDDPNYNEVREIWNAMIDRRPAVIIQCAEADDVPHAKRHQLPEESGAGPGLYQ